MVLGKLKKILPHSLRDYLIRRSLKSKYINLHLGENCTIVNTEFGKNVNIASNVTLINSKIGDYTYIGPGSVICNVEIGKFCSIAPQVYIGLGSHPTNFISTHPVFYLRRPELNWMISDKDYFNEFAKTKIGNDVWIGLRGAVKDGVVVLDGAMIAAGAVVVKDVPPYAICGGVPAKVIRSRFNQEDVNYLLEFNWWNKSEEWLQANYKKFHNFNDFRQLNTDM